LSGIEVGADRYLRLFCLLSSACFMQGGRNGEYLMVSRLRALRGRSARLFLAVSINAFGAGMFFPFALLYYQEVTELPVRTIGFAITAATLVTLSVNPLAGAFVDRFGARRIVVVSQAIEGCGFIGYLFVANSISLFLAALVATSGTRMFYAAFSTLIADSVSGSERDRWYGLVGISQTIGASLSGVIASLLIGSAGLGGFRVIVGANACCLLLSAFLMHEPARRHEIARQGGEGMTILQVVRDRGYMLLVAANGCFMLCSMLMGLGFALYATDGLGAPLWVVAATGIVGSAMLIGLQTRITEATRTYRRTSVMMFAGGLWLIACVLLALAVALPGSIVVPYLLFATLVFTLSQLFYIPASRALAASMAPVAGRGRYIAMFELSYGVAAAAGPALFGLLYDATPAAPWLVMAGVVSVATVMLGRIRLRVTASQNFPLAGLQH
jgi:MFS family permease